MQQVKSVSESVLVRVSITETKHQNQKNQVREGKVLGGGCLPVGDGSNCCVLKPEEAYCWVPAVHKRRVMMCLASG